MSTLVPYAFVWESTYSVTLEVYNIKVGIKSKLNEYLDKNMDQRSMPFFDICPR